MSGVVLLFPVVVAVLLIVGISWVVATKTGKLRMVLCFILPLVWILIPPSMLLFEFGSPFRFVLPDILLAVELALVFLIIWRLGSGWLVSAYAALNAIGAAGLCWLIQACEQGC